MRNIKYTLFFCLFTITLLAQNNDGMLDIKIGQMILIGFPKAEVNQAVLEQVRAGKVGTIIIFEKNVPKSAASFAALKKIIWTYKNAATTFPLLVSIDQEGGKVNRLKDKYGFTKSITANNMGHAHTLDSVRFYAEATAATLAGLGINVNFAPVVDVAVNKENFIYKDGRTFSSDADTVALMAEEFIKPHRRFGVITVLKHFPGHGSSLVNTHFGLADVTSTWNYNELTPYQQLLNKGAVDAIMTAHIVNRQLDPRGYPGTLSSRMIDSLLRKQLRFDGVIFSDDMQMEAISKQYPLEEAIKLAINAGVDILCFANNVPGSEERTVDKIHGIIRSLVERGEIKPERIDESFNRIVKLKFRASQTEGEYLKHQVEDLQKELTELKKPVEQKHEVKENNMVPVVTTPPQEETGKKKKKKKS